MAESALSGNQRQKEITKSFRWLLIVLAGCCVCLLLILFGVVAAFHQRDRARENARDAQTRLEKLQIERIQNATMQARMEAERDKFAAQASMVVLVDNLCNTEHKFQSSRDVLTYLIENDKITQQQASSFPPECRPKQIARPSH